MLTLMFKKSRRHINPYVHRQGGKNKQGDSIVNTKTYTSAKWWAMDKDDEHTTEMMRTSLLKEKAE